MDDAKYQKVLNWLVWNTMDLLVFYQKFAFGVEWERSKKVLQFNSSLTFARFLTVTNVLLPLNIPQLENSLIFHILTFCSPVGAVCRLRQYSVWKGHLAESVPFVLQKEQYRFHHCGVNLKWISNKRPKGSKL